MAVSMLTLGLPFSPALAGETPLPEERLLLLEVTLDRRVLTDTLAAYQTDLGLLVPAGALTRLFDLDIRVSLAEGRVIGSVGQARSAVFLDLASGEARVGASRFPLAPGAAVAGATDIYLSIELVERLFPVQARFDAAALTLSLTARERLPVQERLERLGRLRGFGPGIDQAEAVRAVASPPTLVSWPTFDIAIETAAGTQGHGFRRRYDVRTGGDLMGAGLQGYLASDDRGKPAQARFLLERRDTAGGLLGVTRASAGDGYIPALVLGPRSIAGRGLSFTTRPLEQASIFERIDLRGELPIGHDVELYVNEVLRSGQATPVDGRYEFKDVPLMRGTNVIRIVDHGPHGERSETVRVINVGGGQLERGQTVIDAGIGQQEVPLLDLSGRPGRAHGPGAGDLRAVTQISYGFNATLTGVVGLAAYTAAAGDVRRLVTLGLRGSVLGLGAQADFARDQRDGTALAVALAGQPGGITTTFRNSEYRGGFIDETAPRGGDGRALRRSSEATFDVTLKPLENAAVPVSLRIARDEFSGGKSDLYGSLRTSVPAGGIFASAGLDYERIRGGADERLTGNLSLSTYAAYDWQLRGSFDFDLMPAARPRALAVTLDRALDDEWSLRVGLGQSFIGAKETAGQAGINLRLPFGDLMLGGDYSRPRGDWRVGLQFSFSLVRNPLTGRYAVRRSGAAAGGNLALQAFVDRNGNGVMDAHESPVPGVRLAGGTREERTDAKGRALITGLGYGPQARVAVHSDDVDLAYVETPPRMLAFLPRQGKVAIADFPFTPVGEVLARVGMRGADGTFTGLSALRVRLIARDGAVRDAVTEYDGSVLFDDLRPGAHMLELDPGQAERLGLRLAAPVRLIVPPEGGFVGDVEAVVVIRGGGS